jgi:hypothetical protein
MPIKAYYNAPIADYLKDDAERILGVLTTEHHHALEEQQRWAWLQQISALEEALLGRPNGRIFLERRAKPATRLDLRCDQVVPVQVEELDCYLTLPRE